MPENGPSNEIVALRREMAEYLLEFIDYAAPLSLKNDPQLLPAVQELESVTGIHFLSQDRNNLTDQQIVAIVHLFGDNSQEGSPPAARNNRNVKRKLIDIQHNSKPSSG